MPELPEVETVRRGLESTLAGARIERIEVFESRLRLPVDTEALIAYRGRELRSFRRIGKYLLIGTDTDAAVLVHLGMTGTLRLAEPERRPHRHDHVVWRLCGGVLEAPADLRYRDPRRFGLVLPVSRSRIRQHRLIRDLGPDPTRDLARGELHARSRSSRRPIKNFLMDSRVVVGIGNIYASEALWWARVNPRVAAGRIGASRWERLQGACVSVLQRAIEQGGTTLNDFRDSRGQPGYFEVELQVYGREGASCSRCGATIRRVVQAGRSTFYCAGCQN